MYISPRVVGFVGSIAHEVYVKLTEILPFPSNIFYFDDVVSHELKGMLRLLGKDEDIEFDAMRAWRRRMKERAPEVWMDLASNPIHVLLQRGWVLIPDVLDTQDIRLLVREKNARFIRVGQVGASNPLEHFNSQYLPRTVQLPASAEEAARMLMDEIIKVWELDITLSTCTLCQQTTYSPLFECAQCSKQVCRACMIVDVVAGEIRCHQCNGVERVDDLETTLRG